MLKKRDALFVVAAMVLVGLYFFLAGQKDALGFPLDDSWIHQVYAHNLAKHGEWAFVEGESSTAATSPFYVVLLAIGQALNLSPYFWVAFLGIFALAGAGILGARIGEQLFPQTPYVGVLTGFSLLLAWHLVWAAASGMETMIFMTLSLALIWRVFLEAEAPQQGLILGILGGFLTLTRPEGVVLVGLAGVLMLVAVGWANMPRYLAWSAGVVAGWLIVIAPYTLWNYGLTGELLPSTASAKIAENAPFREDPILTRYLKMSIPLIAGAQFVGLPAILMGIALKFREVRQKQIAILYTLPILWALVHLSLFVIRLPAPFQHGRYVMPVLPPFLLYLPGGMWFFLQTYKNTPAGRVLTRTLALSTALAFPAFAWIGGGAYANDVRIINTEMVETAKWVRDNVPSQDLFAVHDIGALGYFAPRQIVDLAGLVTPELVPIINDYPAQMDFICQRGAKWLMVLPDQRPAAADDPRLTLAYESPYSFADKARGKSPEPWKMRVYALNCP